MAGIKVIENYASNSQCSTDNDLHSDIDLSGRAGRAVKVYKRESFYAAVILLYFLISIGITLAIVPVLTLISTGATTDIPATNPSYSTTEFPTTSTPNSANTTKSDYTYRFVIIKVFRNVFSCIVAAVFIWLVISKTKLVENGAVWWPYRESNQHDQVFQDTDGLNPFMKVHQYHHSSLFGAAMFLGIGSAVMTCLMVITSVQCVVYKQNHGEPATGSLILSVLNNAVFFVLLLAQLAFFYAYNRAVFSSRCQHVFHFAMTLGIASNIWSWLAFTFTAPFWQHVEGEQFHDSVHWCIGDETEAMWYLYKTQRYLSILFPEYSIIAISLLYCHWTTMINFGASLNETFRSRIRNSLPCERITLANLARSNDESVALLSENTTQDGRIATKHGLVDTVKKHPYVTLISFALGFVHLTMKICSHYGSLHDWIQNRDKEIVAIVQLIAEASIFVPATYVIIKCLRCLKYVSPLNLPLSGNDYILIFASAWAIVYDFLQMFAIVDMLRRHVYVSLAVVGIGISVVFSAQTCLQTMFLITIHRRHVDNLKVQDDVRACLIFLTLANAANWLVTGLTHEWAVDSNFVPLISIGFDHIGFDTEIPEQNLTIGSTIILIIYPMLSLYRFHSTVICYNMLKTQQPKVQQRQPTLVLNFDGEDDNSEL